MRYMIRQRLFSWFDSFDIYDERGDTAYTVQGKLSWGHCLHILDRNGVHIATVKYRRVVWRCNHKYKEHGKAGKKCSTPTLTEDEIKTAFVKAMNIYLGDRDEIIRNMEEVRKFLNDTDELEKEKAAQAEEMNVAAELIRKEMDRNARVAQDQKEYDRKFAALEERYRKAEAACREAEDRIRRQGARNRLLGQMIKQVKELEAPVTEFDAGLWGVFVDRMTIMADGKKVVSFKDGNEIEV